MATNYQNFFEKDYQKLQNRFAKNIQKTLTFTIGKFKSLEEATIYDIIRNSISTDKKNNINLYRLY